MGIVYAIAAALSTIAAIITTLQTAATLLFRRRGRFFGPGPRPFCGSSGPFPQDVFSPHRAPAVSILKPVCGTDDDLEACIESFAALLCVDYEVILSFADPHDPAIPIVERVIRRHPDVSWKIVVGGRAALENGNRKVARLIAALPHARAGILFISDSNVRVERHDISRTVDAFRDPRTGCVSNLFSGSGARSFGASIESLHLLTFVVPGMVTAAAAGVPCVVGKSMALRRDALAAIGGFEAFAGVLAEDQAIGLAVREAGYRVVLSPVIVRNVIVTRTLRAALARQIRWSKIRYAFSKTVYTMELLLFPLPYAILAALVHPSMIALPIVTLLLRMAQVALLAEATGAAVSFRELLFVPLFDLLHFAAQFVPYADNHVTWRGYSARIGPGTILLDVPVVRRKAA